MGAIWTGTCHKLTLNLEDNVLLGNIGCDAKVSKGHRDPLSAAPDSQRDMAVFCHPCLTNTLNTSDVYCF